MDTRTPGLLFSALFLALRLPQGAQAALHIQMIPEQPQKNQDLLLSLHGVPSTAQDFVWYLGEETSGGTRLFSYIPGLPRPQRDGSAMGQRDIVGFPNGSMLLRAAQPSDSGTYQVAATMNPAWTMKAKIDVQVADALASSSYLSVNAGITAAISVGSLAIGSLLVCGVAYLLVTRSRKGRSRRNRAEKPAVNGTPESGDSNIYEVMPSPGLLVSPVSGVEPGSPPMVTPGSKTARHEEPLTCAPPLQSLPPPPPPAPPEPQPESQHYQDLLNPDPAPYCQLVQLPDGPWALPAQSTKSQLPDAIPEGFTPTERTQVTPT
ncbi:carcinoembryonic antigen-related cell adhesion molecule 19 [Apodemus sylvaticus]|uniref:carcinoembryonic antigen-related cell adhesion molecule 19 n=1 Tax=Apodemus sylvaticus TaxID=10129 RepID=UPI0022419611|nr:carcinoembryonic antigen-related cell adhesion molecule 19 [Apodemus sylvaticus]